MVLVIEVFFKNPKVRKFENLETCKRAATERNGHGYREARTEFIGGRADHDRHCVAAKCAQGFRTFKTLTPGGVNLNWGPLWRGTPPRGHPPLQGMPQFRLKHDPIGYDTDICRYLGQLGHSLSVAFARIFGARGSSPLSRKMYYFIK